MKRSVITEEVLGSTVEDHYGLYEIIWGLRGLLLDRTEQELKALAEGEIRELLAEDKVAVYRKGAEGNEVVLNPKEAEATLSDERNWSVPAHANSVQILLAATEKGKDDRKSSVRMRNKVTRNEVVRNEVLDAAVEDNQGLWEIVSRLPGLLRDWTDAELRELAEGEIRELLEKGYVALYRRTGAVGEVTLLQPNEVEAALADETSWKVPPEPESEEILVGATDLGEAEYYSESPQ